MQISLAQLAHPKSTNTEEINLKNCAAVASIEVWDLDQVMSHLREAELCLRQKQSYPLGFQYFSDRFLQRKYQVSSELYPKLEELPIWQRQDYGNCKEWEFDRAIVSRVGPLVTGIIYCEWTKFRAHDPTEAYWAYSLNFIDVHEAWQERGIAVALLGALDKQPWLNKKILKLTSFSLVGRERLSKVIFRELKARNYIVLPEDYCWIALPTEEGVWESPKYRYVHNNDT